ncbi:MAG: STAS domain-containing protein [Vulcanimicrobiaceae bacterium]
MSAQFHLGHSLENGYDVVRVHGECDLYASPSLAAKLAESDDTAHRIVDFSECLFVDSSVIAVLIRALKERSGTLRVVVDGKSSIARIFTITHLDQLVPIFSTLDEAKSS